jgi:hypothetical protein
VLSATLLDSVCSSLSLSTVSAVILRRLYTPTCVPAIGVPWRFHSSIHKKEAAAISFFTIYHTTRGFRCLLIQKSLFVFFLSLVLSRGMFHLDGLGFVDGFAPFPLCL